MCSSSSRFLLFSIPLFFTHLVWSPSDCLSCAGPFVPRFLTSTLYPLYPWYLLRVAVRAVSDLLFLLLVGRGRLPGGVGVPAPRGGRVCLERRLPGLLTKCASLLGVRGDLRGLEGGTGMRIGYMSTSHRIARRVTIMGHGPLSLSLVRRRTPAPPIYYPLD